MGSEFTIRIPRPQAASVDPSRVKPEKPIADRACTIPRRRILVVDDSLLNAASLEKLLIALGQEVRTAHDGKQALEMARDYQPDVMLLDIGLPVIDGYEVARLCRQEPALAKNDTRRDDRIRQSGRQAALAGGRLQCAPRQTGRSRGPRALAATHAHERLRDEAARSGYSAELTPPACSSSFVDRRARRTRSAHFRTCSARCRR